MAWSNIPDSNGATFRANINAAFATLYNQQSTSPNANTAALRDGNGDLSAAHFNGSGSGLTGTAANLTAGAANSVPWSGVTGKPDLSALSFAWNWAGRYGQPSWLWGGSDGANMYVYDPSNFSVARASSAGTVDTIRAWAYCVWYTLQDAYNISSVTQSATGLFQCNFTNALSTNAYVANATISTAGDTGSKCLPMIYSRSASQVTVAAYVPINGNLDTVGIYGFSVNCMA